MKIVLTGGGTAGHVIPNLALIPELKKHFDNIYYMGGKGIEERLVKSAGLPFYATEVIKLTRGNLIKNLRIPFVLMKGVRSAKDILSTIMPDVVFSKGGYASLPACFAARKLKIPVVIHESDMTLGLANKLTAKFASKVLTSFPETAGEYVGSPVRDEIYLGSKARAAKKYSLPQDKPVALFVGGSSGSTAINDVVYKALPVLTKTYFVVHIAGKKRSRSVRASDYLQIEYASDIADLFAAADVVVTRGGAGALAELTAIGKKVLAIPLPKGCSRGDQIQNTKAYEKRGQVSMLDQSLLTPESLTARLNALLLEPSRAARSEFGEANKKIVNKLLETVRQKK